jgi:hypothetical protein
MATVTPGYTFTNNEVVTPAKLTAAATPEISNIVNADISLNANISDAKLNTISTVGKVSNSATTATTYNTPNTIVLRDANGGISVSTFEGKLAPTVFSSETALTDISTDDLVLVYDSSSQTTKKVTVNDLMKTINNVPYLEFAWITAPNAAGASIPANVVTTLNINTEVADTGNFGSASSNQIILSAGTYRYFVEVPCSVPYLEGQVFLKNTTANLFLAKHKWIGPSGGNTEQYWTYYPAHPLKGPFEGQFSLNAQSAIELQFLASGAVSIGVSSGSYTIRSTVSTENLDQRTTIKLWKVG